MFSIFIFGANQDQIPAELKGLATSITCEDMYTDKILEPLDPNPNMILCYAAESSFSTLEIAQTLRMNYPDLPIFFIATDRSDFDKKRLVKNGFTQAYLLPWEKADFLRSLQEESIFSVIPELRDYQAIKVVDLTPGTVLDFSLKAFLPRNNMLVTFSAEGVPVSPEKFSKLYENKMNTLFIHKDEIEKFRQYTAETFKRLLRPNQMSETERQQKLEKCVRDLISDMFIIDTKENTYGKSQSLLNEVKEMIKLLITDENADLVKKLDTLVNQEGSFYQHLSNVSAYAGLFAMILGFEKPEEMSLAGLLHDMGKINLPPDIAELNEEDMGPHAQESYRKHPKHSIDVAKFKRISLPDSVMKAILQHHEAMNGSGYPSGLAGARISKEGRLLAIANTFDKMTLLRQNEKTLTPAEALLKMIEDNSTDPGKMLLDLEMLKKLKTCLIK